MLEPGYCNDARLLPQAISDDWRIKLAMPLFLLVDALLARPKVARYLFDRFRTRENLRTVLQARSATRVKLNVYK